MSRASLPRRLLAEFLGTMVLLTAVIGSGIMAERLAAGNAAIALLANTMATVFALFVLIEVLGPISGAHFNPVVTVTFKRAAALTHSDVLLYVVAQLAGAAMGAMLANVMFDLPVIQWAARARGGAGQWIAEVVATAGLVVVIARAAAGRAPAVVAAYIGAAYWFTSSTSFANPAAAFGRMFSDTFAGIAPASLGAFVASQVAGGVIGVVVARLLGDRAPKPPTAEQQTALSSQPGHAP